MKNTIITLDSNPLSVFSESIDCKVKYYKKNILENSETYILKVLDDEISLKTFKNFAYNGMMRRCSCDYDCCGHWFTTSIGVKRVSKNKFKVHLTYARNY